MNTETVDKPRVQEVEAPMRAHYFDRHAKAIGDTDAGEGVKHIPDAKQRGRNMGAAAFKLWLGEDKRENEPDFLYYIQPWYGARYQQVQRNGFFRYLEGIISREERRSQIQVMRSLTDPAYQHETEDADDGG